MNDVTEFYFVAMTMIIIILKLSGDNKKSGGRLLGARSNMAHLVVRSVKRLLWGESDQNC